VAVMTRPSGYGTRMKAKVEKYITPKGCKKYLQSHIVLIVSMSWVVLMIWTFVFGKPKHGILLELYFYSYILDHLKRAKSVWLSWKV